MKNMRFILLIIIGSPFILFSCKKDDVERLPDAANPPQVVLANEIIITTLGSEFIMEADLVDSVGLKSFTLRYDDWYLYNTISLQDSSYPVRRWYCINTNRHIAK